MRLGRAVREHGRKPGTLVVVAVLMAGGLAACSSSEDHSFPSDVRLNFVSACIDNGGTRESCGCMFEAIEEEFALDEYVDIEAEMLATGVLPAEMGALMASCPAVRAPASSDAPSAGQHVLSQADSFDLTVDGTTFGSDPLSAETVCVAVSVSNPTADDVMALGIFSLALPSGRIEYTTDVAAIPALAPGGSASATVCFPSNGERGQGELRFASPVTSYAWPVTIG